MAIRISDFSTLNFRTDWKGRTNTDSEYIPRLLPTDKVLVQFETDIDTYNKMTVLHVRLDDGWATALTPSILHLGGNSIVAQVGITSTMQTGLNSVRFRDDKDNTLAESLFCVAGELEDSVLLTYTNYRNDWGTYFEEPFSFRVEGIFLPGETSFEVSTEDFRDQRYGLTQLSALPYEKQTLTVGTPYGVPNWVGRKLNLIFSCSDVAIDGVNYVRSEGAAPKMTVLQQDSPLFVWKMEVEASSMQTGESDYFRTVPASLTFDGVGGSSNLKIETSLCGNVGQRRRVLGRDRPTEHDGIHRDGPPIRRIDRPSGNHHGRDFGRMLHGCGQPVGQQLHRGHPLLEGTIQT